MSKLKKIKHMVVIFLCFFSAAAFSRGSHDIGEVAKLYCASCHVSMDGNTNIESYFEWLSSKGVENDKDLELLIRSVLESDFMPPSEWHRKQLRQIIGTDE